MGFLTAFIQNGMRINARDGSPSTDRRSRKGAKMFGIDDIIGGGLKIVSQVIDRAFPDPAERDRAKLEMMKLQQEGAFKELEAELQVALAQVGTNTEEAKSSILLVAGWRPFIGWVCGVAMALAYIPKAIVITGLWTYQAVLVVSAWNGQGAPVLPAFPDLGLTEVLGLLGGMLGLGGFRTLEKFKGVAR